MDDLAVIEVLRDAAEALTMCLFMVTSEAAETELVNLATRCHDAATALARAHLTETPGGR